VINHTIKDRKVVEELPPYSPEYLPQCSEIPYHVQLREG
jgi:hypothetical protein